MSYALVDGLPYVTMVPGDILDWSRDWTDELEDGESIDAEATVWSVPAGLTAGAASVSGAYTSQWITAGETLGRYALVCAMVTSAGRKRLRTLTIEVIPAK